MLHLLQRFSGRNVGITLAFVLAGVAIAVGLWAFLGSETSEPEAVVSTTELDGMSSEALERAGLELSALDPGVQPNVSRREAEKVALEESRGPAPGASVRDAIFTHVVSSSFNCRDCDAWIVNLDVEDCCAYLESFVVLVDAESGAYLSGIGACKQDVQGCP